jgi:hypothetical protein
MAQLTETIRDYEVSLDTDMNGDGQTTGCWIRKGQFSASLSCLEATGVLTSASTDEEMSVSPFTIAEIADWAEENGY